MKPKKGLVNFLRKVEGKPPVTPKFKRIPFPEVDNGQYFRELCYVVYHTYLPGQTLDADLAWKVEYAFDWCTAPVGLSLWADAHRSGYLHPECYDCLCSWHKMLENGEKPGGEYHDLESAPF